MTKLTIVLLSSLLFSSGCTSIITAVSDQPVYENKTSRSLGEKLDDRVLRSKAIINLSADKALSGSNIEVYSYEGHILLVGQVANKELAARAENAIKPLRDLRGVKNLLSIGDKAPFIRRSKDTFIGTKLRTKLLLNNEASVGNIKLVVEKAEVYLYGLATKEQAELAISLAKETRGVKTVVNAINYVELQKRKVKEEITAKP